MTVEQLYETAVRALPAPDRLRLATMILNDIPPRAVVDYSEEWTEEDIRDATRYSLQRAAASFGEEPGEEPAAVGDTTKQEPTNAVAG
jgi:hypothetical protein